jgi:acidic type I keratin
MSKYVIYALMVTFSVTAANWVRMFKVAGSGGGGSSWSSRTGSGGGSYGGGSSGGSHK